MIDHIQTKAVVTVAEMARMVGLSRARFYQLQGTAFPWPVYDIVTRRPIYIEEQQQMCLEVRRRNCGIDGRPVLFYARRWTGQTAITVKLKPKASPAKADTHADCVAAIRSLGLTWVTSADVGAAAKQLFPMGIANVDSAELIRAVFVHLKRQNTRDNVER